MTECITGNDWWECNHQPNLKNFYVVAIELHDDDLYMQVEQLNEAGRIEDGSHIQILPFNWIAT